MESSVAFREAGNQVLCRLVRRSMNFLVLVCFLVLVWYVPCNVSWNPASDMICSEIASEKETLLVNNSIRTGMKYRLWPKRILRKIGVVFHRGSAWKWSIVAPQFAMIWFCVAFPMEFVGLPGGWSCGWDRELGCLHACHACRGCALLCRPEEMGAGSSGESRGIMPPQEGVHVRSDSSD